MKAKKPVVWLRSLIQHKILARSGFLARRVRNPNFLTSPIRRRLINVVRGEGIGDVLMATPALRELKKANPKSWIRFYTNYEQLVRDLPYIDEVLPFSQRPTENRIYLEYASIVPSSVHLSKLFGDRLDVDVIDTKPDCIIQKSIVAKYKEEWKNLPGPIVAVLRRASRHTPNKDWSNESWHDLTEQICKFGSVVEIGVPDDLDRTFPKNYLDLRGKTSLEELAAVVAAADIYTGPVSGPMHIAAAVGTPAVVVIGGYEHPVNSHYPGNVEFYTSLPCSPCWLLEPCPFNLKCLKAISSAQVRDAIVGMWEKMQRH